MISRLARAIALVGLATLAALLAVTATAGAKAKPLPYKPGKHIKASTGGWNIAFSGDASWRAKYTSDGTADNITYHTVVNEGSNTKWSTSAGTQAQPITVPYPCKIGHFNACAAVIGATEQGRGQVTGSYTVADVTSDDTGAAPVTVNCTGALSARMPQDSSSGYDGGVQMHAAKNGKTFTLSWTSGDPLEPAYDKLTDTSCKGPTSEAYWKPGNGFGDRAQNWFTMTTVPIPFSAIQTAQSLTVSVTGPSSRTAQSPTCAGIDRSDTRFAISCDQTGAYHGLFTMTRVRAHR